MVKHKGNLALFLKSLISQQNIMTHLRTTNMTRPFPTMPTTQMRMYMPAKNAVHVSTPHGAAGTDTLWPGTVPEPLPRVMLPMATRPVEAAMATSGSAVKPDMSADLRLVDCLCVAGLRVPKL